MMGVVELSEVFAQRRGAGRCDAEASAETRADGSEQHAVGDCQRGADARRYRLTLPAVTRGRQREA